MFPVGIRSFAVLGQLCFIFLLHLFLNGQPAFSCYSAIFSFGDSVADTGNELSIYGSSVSAARFPYGETYFHYPTGRSSDGRLIIDFIAQALGFPLVPPYITGNKSKKFELGANFAVSGACTLNNDLLKALGLNATWRDFSLGTQFQWFKKLLLERSISSRAGPAEILSSSLVIMGEIGVNDYYHFLDFGALEEMRTSVPFVIDKIGSTIHDLLQLGSETVVVPGLFPMGCVPKMLTLFQSKDSEQYDSRTGCIKWLNEFSEYHNHLLKKRLHQLQKVHHDAKIMYADYYGAIMPAFQSPKRFGINVTLAACCGGGGQYNFSPDIVCGNETFVLCEDPSSYIYFDGVHRTEAAHRIMALGLLEGQHITPPLNRSCLQGLWSVKRDTGTAEIELALSNV